MAQHQVSVRLDGETLARVDALAPAFSKEWRRATRSDVLRILILDALPRFEQAGGPAPPNKARRAPRQRR